MISKFQAIEIADNYINVPEKREYSIYDRLPDGCHVYDPGWGSCWYLLTSFPRHPKLNNLLISSRLVVISRTTGEVVCGGAANDEG
jgi:hypothetical protein